MKYLALSLALLLLAPIAQAKDTKERAKPVAASTKAKTERQVMFNTSSVKYHDPSCRWAEKCTKNCVKVSESEAIQRGGVPCKVCGG